MNGSGIIRGLGITIGHFIMSYIEDLKGGKNRYNSPEGIAERSTSHVKGIFTVQYPEEKIPVPEEFRYFPFLVYDVDENGERKIRCTACGICAKVCPPQCIWITREKDPNTGRPVSSPLEFSIDVDLCMNCGFCAEFCPFDSIKMDHIYEVATQDRFRDHIYKIETLLKPASYYAGIRPMNYALEEAIKAEKEAAKAAKKAAESG